jgi:polyphosphate kinase
MRERLERARNAKAQAKTAALEHQRLDEALASASRAGVPADIVVEAVTVGGEANCSRA